MDAPLKVIGFTFIRNAILYDYPVVESIRSILPLVDHVVVAVGESSDNTLELIQSIDPERIKIVSTRWDDSLRAGGRVLAAETDKALQAVDSDAHWAIYIQGDEVLHEKDHSAIRSAMERYKNDTKVDGLLFNYLHFYGSYDFVGASANWYRNEIRCIRPNGRIYSFRDAQGFRKDDDQLLSVKAIDACVYHYGWVKQPEAMQKKQVNFNKLWHDDAWVEQHIAKVDAFEYEKHVEYLARFQGTHPSVMQARIKAMQWQFNHDPSMDRRTVKNKLKDWLRTCLGLDFSYKNYRLLK